MKKLLIVLWVLAVGAASVIAFENREVLDCETATYVRHGLEYTTTQCK